MKHQKTILYIFVTGLLVVTVFIILYKNSQSKGDALTMKKTNPLKNQALTNQSESSPSGTIIPLDSPMLDSTLASQTVEIEKDLTAAREYTAVLNTQAGVIKIKLNSKETPKTVNNFVTLINKGFYNGTVFHRVIKGFMIQGGDPKGDGTGGPGYTFDDEPFSGDYSRGIVAMANAGPNTNGSQFFIMHEDNPLPKNYVIFGQVSEGIEVVDKIANQDVARSSTGEMSKPVQPVKVISAQIIEK